MTSKWLALACECMCGHTAVSLLDSWTHEEEGPGEVVRVGDDWRALVREVAHEHSRQFGLRISARCTVTYVKDQDFCNEVTDWVYYLADDQQRTWRRARLEELREEWRRHPEYRVDIEIEAARIMGGTV